MRTKNDYSDCKEIERKYENEMKDAFFKREVGQYLDRIAERCNTFNVTYNMFNGDPMAFELLMEYGLFKVYLCLDGVELRDLAIRVVMKGDYRFHITIQTLIDDVREWFLGKYNLHRGVAVE